MCMIQKKSAGAPLVKISDLRLIDEIGSETEIEIMLALNQSRTTSIRDWRMEIEVNYADDSTYQASLWDSIRLPERLVCLVPTRSERDDEAVMTSYQARLEVRFTTISSIILHKEFAIPRPSKESRGSISAMKKGRIAILDACPIQDGDSGKEVIDVWWDADAPSQAVISRFDLELKATHANGAVRRACKSVSGAQRQARLTIAASGSEITSIKTGLGATFTWFGSISVAKVGSFHP
jgi:hypothetical protein